MALSVGKIIRKAWESSSLSQKDFAEWLDDSDFVGGCLLAASWLVFVVVVTFL